MKNRRYIFSLFLAVLPLFSFARTNPSADEGGILRFHTIQLPEQMAGSNILRVAQDKAGLLWLVTGNGLYRYDGRELLHFGLKTTPALPSLAITSLQPDLKGNLWIGFQDGAARFDLKTWTITRLDAKDWNQGRSQDKDITSMACLKDGSVYLGTQSGKLYAVSWDASGKPRLTLVLHMPTPGKNRNYNSILNIQEPVPGQLWMGTGTGMLVNLPVLNHGRAYGTPAYFRPEETAGYAISNICYDRSGQCLFSADSHIFLADIKQLFNHRDEAIHLSGKPRKGYVSMLSLPVGTPYKYYSPSYISGNRIGVFTYDSLQRTNIYRYNFRTGNWHLATPYFKLQFPGKNILAVSDKSPVTFVCSTGGITSLEFRDAPVTPLLDGFDNANSIRSIFKDGDYLYIGSYRDHFIRYNIQTGISDRLSSMYIYSMIRWNTDTLLLATEGNGLYWYLPAENRFIAITPVNYFEGAGTHPRLRSFVTALCRINHHLILAGTYQGIELIDPSKNILYPVFKDSLSKVLQNVKTNAIIPLHTKKNPSDNGDYLVATASGVFEVNPGNGQVRYFLDKQAGNKIRQVSVSCLLNMNGRIWIGTNGLGVITADTSGRLIPDKWINKQLTSPIVYSMTRSGNKILIGTYKGLNVLHLKDSSLTSYTTYNGLAANEFNQSAVCNSGGVVYMGTTNGLVRWKDKRILNKKEKQPFHVFINQLTIADKQNHQKILYNLSYLQKDSRHILVPDKTKYVSVTFDKPDGNNKLLDYYYRLHTTDQWTELGARRALTFVNMQPGIYKLQFGARSPGGGWMEDAFQIPLTVKPAYYQTIWFRLLLLITLVMVLFLIFRYRELQRNKERNLRIKIASDLHDEVGSSLTRIWHQAQSCLSARHFYNENSNAARDTLKNNPINGIAQTSREALSMMSDMVWSIDARFDTLDELILRMKDYIFKLNNESETQVGFEVMNNIPDRHKISQSVRQNLLLVFKEGINNALRHGDGKEIKVTLCFRDKINLRIENGYCKKQDKQPVISQGGRGHLIMGRRVKKMEGTIQIEKTANNYILSIEV